MPPKKKGASNAAVAAAIAAVDDIDDETFEIACADALEFILKSANCLKKGAYAMLKEGKFPCRIVDLSTSKTGKHGSAKVHVTGLDVFTNKKYEELFMSSDKVKCPNITRHEYQICDFQDATGSETFAELTVLDKQDRVMSLKVDTETTCYNDIVRTCNFDNRSYSVKTIKFGDNEKPESIKEEQGQDVY